MIIRILLTIAVFTASMWGQTTTYTGLNDFSAGQIRLPEATIAGLPSAGASTNRVYRVTDALTPGNCATGGGGATAICSSNGAAWQPVTGNATVTSVAATVPGILNVTGSPVTTSGTLAFSLTSQNSSTVFAGPATGQSAAPSFRNLALSDLPASYPAGQAANVKAYGALGDSKAGYQGRIASGSNILNCSDCAFDANDAGRTVYVYGANSGVFPVTGASCVSGVTTITFTGNAWFDAGQTAAVAGVTPSAYNGTFTLSSATTSNGVSTVSYPQNCPGSYVSGGTVTYGDGASTAVALQTTITSVANASTATLALPASQAANGALVQVIGTDDSSAINSALSAACAAANAQRPAVLYFPSGAYNYNSLAAGKFIIPCSNLRITGSATIISSGLNYGLPSGQGLPVIQFPSASTGRQCNGGTITPGATTLIQGGQGTVPCNFTSADAGTSVVVEFAGEDYLPLFANIAACNGAHCADTGAGTTVTLDVAAGTATPATPVIAGFGDSGANVYVGVTPVINVEIDHLTLMNVAVWQPFGSLNGYGVLMFSPSNASDKRDIRIHDNTILSAASNLVGGNNGLLYNFWIQNNHAIGGFDTAFYVQGTASRGWITDNLIENTFPGLPNGTPAFNQGITNAGSHVIIARNKLNLSGPGPVNCGICTENWPGFSQVILDNNITVQHTGAGAPSGIYAIGYHNAEIRGNKIRMGALNSVGIELQSSASVNTRIVENEIAGTHGNTVIGILTNNPFNQGPPNSITIAGNTITNCAGGIRVMAASGTNYIQGNHLSNCAPGAIAFAVTTDPSAYAGTITYVSPDNTIDGGYFSAAVNWFDNNTVYGNVQAFPADSGGTPASPWLPLGFGTNPGLFNSSFSPTGALAIAASVPQPLQGWVTAAMPGSRVPCMFDNAAIAGHYVQPAAAFATCHDAGASVPASGRQILGQVLQTVPALNMTTDGSTVTIGNGSGSAVTVVTVRTGASNPGLAVGQWFNIYLNGAAGVRGTNFNKWYQVCTPTAAGYTVPSTLVNPGCVTPGSSQFSYIIPGITAANDAPPNGTSLTITRPAQILFNLLRPN